jgi:hypothetical protein
VACDGAMAIKEGDLVVVVKPMPCCGGTRMLGYTFMAGRIRLSSENAFCGTCKHVDGSKLVTEIPDGRVIRLSLLKKIPPLSELEGKERERELVLK